MKRVLLLLLVACVLLMGTLSVIDEFSQVISREATDVPSGEIFIYPECQDPAPTGSGDGSGPGGGGGVPG
jgi:hypothetical protein